MTRSRRIQGLTQSHIRRMSRECERRAGINLGQGVCDLPTPPAVLNAAAEAVQADISAYTRPEGTAELRAAIAAKMQSHNRLPANPDTDVVVTIGATGAFNCAVHALFNSGDEIIVFEPYYGYHVNTLVAAGCTPVFVPLRSPDWSFDPEALRQACSSRTRGIVVNTPGNPSGKVFTEMELQSIADLCQERNLLALTDEIYEYIVFDGHRHVSLATLPGMWERTVTISGFSKTFSITGWRLGYAVAPAHLAEPITLVNDLFYVCAPAPLQVGVARGMQLLDSTYYRQMADDYQCKRDMFCAALSRIGLTPHIPQGAYYVLADIASLGQSDDVAAAMHLLDGRGVASIPGSAFFQSGTGRGLVRFCFAQDTAILAEACRRLTP
jgi:aminotransferase